MTKKKLSKEEQEEKERIEKIQQFIHDIRPSPEVIQRGREISRELHTLSFEKLHRPFTI